MFDTHLRHARRGRSMIVVGLATMALALAACGGASPSASASASESASGSAFAARCAFTPDGSPSATVQIVSFAFGDGRADQVERVAMLNRTVLGDGVAHAPSMGGGR